MEERARASPNARIGERGENGIPYEYEELTEDIVERQVEDAMNKLETIHVRLPRRIVEQIDSLRYDNIDGVPVENRNRTEVIKELIVIGLKEKSRMSQFSSD